MFKWNMKRYNIYVGLNDSVTHKQMYSTAKYISILKKVCQSYNVAFSFSVIKGSFMHEDGTVTDENSLCINLFDEEEKTVREIAGDLCTFFNQESVIITEDQAKMYYLHGESKVQEEISKRSED